VDEVVLGQVFSEYFCLPCQFSLRTRLSSEASKMGPLGGGVPR
jgi:hypothetical protein